MASPTISLALIAKNEEKNINRLLDSVEGCFDEIVLVDTGSTDKTKEIAASRGCVVHDFVWVNSFCKARNFAFSKCTKDYIMWMDLDDVLGNPDGFKHWKESAMQFADYFFATYNYALDKDGKPICSFIRERVFKREIGPEWRYDLHEGIIPKPGWRADMVPNTVWTVNHMRDAEDIKADKSRNIKILESMAASQTLDGRLQFYFGKELYEAQRYPESLIEFKKAMDRTDLEHHDRILTYQYAAYAAQACANQLKDDQREQRDRYVKNAIDYAHEGIKLDRNRAEFHVILGDAYLQMQDLISAVPHYGAAKVCFNAKANGAPYEGAIYSFLDCYGQQPMLQLSRIYLHLGLIDQAEKEAKECFEKYGSPDAKAIIDQVAVMRPLITVDNNQEQTEDIVFTCPPQQAYPFDEEAYKEKPMGGSETALIQMAKYLKLKTGRKVLVFNARDEDLVAQSGVEYISNKKTNQYMSKFKPRAHIAWRHNIKLTNAKTYLWAHDLETATTEAIQNFDKMICLSNFHKSYTMGKKGVPADKILVTRNGITPEKFIFNRPGKNPNKFVYMSSPDRGLYGAILVCEEVRKHLPDVSLDIYYGLGNLRKYGLSDLADRIDDLIKDRPWVKVHDFTEQNQMYREVADAAIWIHPATFLETFCITALEMLALGIYPVTRRLAGLGDTLAAAEKCGQATMLESNNLSHYITQDEIKAYAKECIEAVEKKKWLNVDLDLNAHSWESVAEDWKQFMEL